MVKFYMKLFLVGALTNKFFAFKARSWELVRFSNLDLTDSWLSVVHVDIKFNNILRILPMVDFLGNVNWLSDRGRFFFDGLLKQRLIFSLMRLPGYRRGFSITWLSLVKLFLAKRLPRGLCQVEGFCGGLSSLETLSVYKDLVTVSELDKMAFVDFRWYDNCGMFESSKSLYIVVSENLLQSLPSYFLTLRQFIGKRSSSSLQGNLGFSNNDESKNGILNLGNSLWEFYNIFFGKTRIGKLLLEFDNITFILSSALKQDCLGKFRYLFCFLQKVIGRRLNVRLVSTEANSIGLLDLNILRCRNNSNSSFDTKWILRRAKANCIRVLYVLNLSVGSAINCWGIYKWVFYQNFFDMIIKFSLGTFSSFLIPKETPYETVESFLNINYEWRVTQRVIESPFIFLSEAWKVLKIFCFSLNPWYNWIQDYHGFFKSGFSCGSFSQDLLMIWWRRAFFCFLPNIFITTYVPSLYINTMFSRLSRNLLCFDYYRYNVSFFLS